MTLHTTAPLSDGKVRFSSVQHPKFANAEPNHPFHSAVFQNLERNMAFRFKKHSVHIRMQFERKRELGSTGGSACTSVAPRRRRPHVDSAPYSAIQCFIEPQWPPTPSSCCRVRHARMFGPTPTHPCRPGFVNAGLCSATCKIVSLARSLIAAAAGARRWIYSSTLAYGVDANVGALVDRRCDEQLLQGRVRVRCR